MQLGAFGVELAVTQFMADWLKPWDETRCKMRWIASESGFKKWLLFRWHDSFSENLLRLSSDTIWAFVRLYMRWDCTMYMRVWVKWLILALRSIPDICHIYHIYGICVKKSVTWRTFQFYIHDKCGGIWNLSTSVMWRNFRLLHMIDVKKS